MKLKLSKIYIKYFLMLAVLFLGLSALRYQLSVTEMEGHVDDDVADYFHMLENHMESTYRELERDLIYMRGMTETMFDEGATSAQIAGSYYEFSKAIGMYDQIRYLNEAGIEVVRVNYENGNPRIVIEEELQDKSDRFYVHDLQQLDHDAIYISSVDLNMENGKLEVPLKPMIRIGMTVEDQNGDRAGFVILNYLVDNWLTAESQYYASLAEHVIDFSEFRIVNMDGYYLQHEDPEKEWGFVFPERDEENLAIKMPELWSVRDGEGVIKESTKQEVIYLRKIHAFDSGTPYRSHSVELGYMVYEISMERYEGFFKASNDEGLLLAVISLVLALLGAYFLENSAKSRRDLIQSLHLRASRDQLTGLYNKQGFLELVPVEKKRWDDGISAIGYFDIDDFKSVNDQYGHAVGDEVLQEVGKRLTEVLRDRDLPARIHGDEFNILLKLRKEIDARVVARRLINRMKDPIQTEVGEVAITVSLGIAFFRGKESFDEVAERADRLMYEVKRTGKSDYRIEGLAPDA